MNRSCLNLFEIFPVRPGTISFGPLPVSCRLPMMLTLKTRSDRQLNRTATSPGQKYRIATAPCDGRVRSKLSLVLVGDCLVRYYYISDRSWSGEQNTVQCRPLKWCCKFLALYIVSAKTLHPTSKYFTVLLL